MEKRKIENSKIETSKIEKLRIRNIEKMENSKSREIDETKN